MVVCNEHWSSVTPQGTRRDVCAEKVRVMLLCGADLLESMTKPGVWIPEQVRVLLQEHGVVCICRTGQDTRQLLFEHDILFSNRRHIMIVDELIHNNVSSTKVRRNIARGLSVKYLVADTVINYIKTHQLYTTNPVAHQPWLSSVFMQTHTSSSNFEELFLSNPMCFAYIYGTIFRRDTCLVSVRT
jgi:hypothetical protein